MMPNPKESIYVGAEERDVQDRSKRYFGELYPRLQGAKVLVIGAGAVGTEVIKNLVMVGVSPIYLVDFDKVSVSNLNRCVFFRPEDHGQTYKVDAVAREVAHSWPHIQLSTYRVPIQEAPDEVWDVAVVIVAVDNNEARYYINQRLLASDRPPFVINGALGRTFVEVQILLLGQTACLVCPWSQEYLDRLWKRVVRQNCDQFFFETVEKFPAISFLNSLAGAMMAGETIKILVGLPLWQEKQEWEPEHVPALGKVIHYDIREHEFSIGPIYPNPRCAEIFCRQKRRK